MNIRIARLTLLGLLSVVSLANAQDIITNYTIENTDKQNSPLINPIRNFGQDSAGTFYIGTDVGITRYDATTWKTDFYPKAKEYNYYTLFNSDTAYGFWADLIRYQGDTYKDYGLLMGVGGGKNIILDTNHIWNCQHGRISYYDHGNVTTWDSILGQKLRNNFGFLRAPDGKIWFIGYTIGIFCYDGKKWTLYKNEQGDLPGDFNNLFVDGKGNIWAISGRSGVAKFDGSTWTIFNTSTGLRYNYVDYLMSDSKGNVYINYNIGSDLPHFNISKYDGSSWTHFDKAPIGVSHLLAITPNDEVWAKGYNEYSRFDGTKWHVYNMAALKLPSNIDGLAQSIDNQGRLWVNGADDGAAYFDGNQWQLVTEPTQLLSNSLRRPFFDSQGWVWFSTQKGFSYHDGITWNHNDTLPSRYEWPAFSFYEDKAGDIWAYGNGLFQFKRSNRTWHYYSSYTDHLRSNQIYSLACDTTEKLWVSTRYGMNNFYANTWSSDQSLELRQGWENFFSTGARTGKLYAYTKEKLFSVNADRSIDTLYNATRDVAIPSINTFAEDAYGTPWIGDRSLYRRVGKEWIAFRNPVLYDAKTENLLFDKQNNAWCLMNTDDTLDIHLIKFNGVEWNHFLLGMKGIFPKQFALDDHDNPWLVCRKDGKDNILYFNDGNFTPWAPSEMLGGATVYKIVVEAGDEKWFLTTEGVYHYTQGTWKHYTILDGLADNHMTTFVRQNKTTVWLGSNNGVSRLELNGGVAGIVSENELMADRLRLFPNPAKEILQVEINGMISASAQIEICNLEGRTMLYQKITGQTTMLPVGSFPEGIYTVMMKGEKTVAKKFIKLP